MATTANAVHEFDKRQEQNWLALEVIRCNERLWEKARGPEPDSLFDSSPEDLEAAQKAGSKLQAFLDEGGDEKDQIAQFCDEMIAAVRQIKSLRWECMRASVFRSRRGQFGKQLSGMPRL